MAQRGAYCYYLAAMQNTLIVDALVVAPSVDHGAMLLNSLAGTGANLRLACERGSLENAAMQADFGALIYGGEIPGMNVHQILKGLRKRFPQAKLVISIEDIPLANALAEAYGGVAVPWPSAPEAFQAGLGMGAAAKRKHFRIRTHRAAHLRNKGVDHAAYVIDISVGGALALTGVRLESGQPVAVQVRLGGSNHVITGQVVYERSADLPKVETWMPFDDSRLTGINFDDAAKPAAAALCRTLDEERRALGLRVVCVPEAPKGLVEVLHAFGVGIEIKPSVDGLDEDPPLLVVADVAAFGVNMNEKLTKLRRSAAVILVSGEEGHSAPGLPVYQVPQQAEQLVERIESFLDHVGSELYRFEDDFSVILLRPGEPSMPGSGVNLGLTGCGFLCNEAFAVGTPVQGLIALARAVEARRFEGVVVYCAPEGERFRTGICFTMEGATEKAYQAYMAAHFRKGIFARLNAHLNL